MIEFDADKDAANIAKHGISLARAEEFDLTAAWIEESDRGAEKRWIAYGDLGDRMYVLVFTARWRRLRAISLRKANARERRFVEARMKDWNDDASG